tara:strand:+ start:16729 stop:18384 length:1656 start_codon:yes stop_codon:yes gene_type:complete
MIKNTLLFFFVFTNSLLFAQRVEDERSLINACTIEANNLLAFINTSIDTLASYQEHLNWWYLNPSSSWSDVPQLFCFLEDEPNQIASFLEDNNTTPSNRIFNYRLALSELSLQVDWLKEYCLKMDNIPRNGSKEDYYYKIIDALNEANNRIIGIAHLSYNFSLFCAINYGKEKLPPELEQLKNIVGQAKNVIMAIRENEDIQLRSYLNQLDLAIAENQKVESLNELKRAGRFQLDVSVLKDKLDAILGTANQIAYWAEQYLQSNQSEQEVSVILNAAINNFNYGEDAQGCSGSYNSLVSQSNNEYLYFTEEPIYFAVNQQQRAEDAVEKIPIKKELTGTGNVEEQSIILEEISTLEQVAIFDATDIHSLDGSLSNNLIIMMDVSASMKISGKLPLLKSSINHLVDIMRSEDRLSLIAYSGKATVLIENAGFEDKTLIKYVLDTLHSSGGTDIEKGLILSYEMALSHFMDEGNNRIIIATDGEFGVSQNLMEFVQSEQKNNVALSIFHFIESKKFSPNTSLERLAEMGKGSYKIITTSEEAREVLIQEVKNK